MDERLVYSDNDIAFRYNLDTHPVPESFTMHTHQMCEIYLFMNGKASFRIEGSEYRLERGDLLVMRPAEAHCIQVQADHPYERLSMHFEPTLFDRIDPEHRLLKVFMDREAGRFNRFSAAEFPDQIPDPVKEDRRCTLMENLLAVSAKLNKAKIGTKTFAIVEGYDEVNLCYVGRTAQDTPEVDGLAYIYSSYELNAGDIVEIKIMDADEYDVTGEVVNEFTK